MPNQQDIQNCILNASYKLFNLVNANLTLINKGGVPSNTAQLQFWKLNIRGLEDMYDFELYDSATTIGLYDRLQSFIGIPTSATIDPDFQAPNTTIIIDGGGGGSGELNQIRFMVAAGTPMPYNYAFSNLVLPIITFAIPQYGDPDNLSSQGTAGMFVNFIYSGVELVSLDIFGNDNGSGEFNEDTYVTITY